MKAPPRHREHRDGDGGKGRLRRSYSSCISVHLCASVVPGPSQEPVAPRPRRAPYLAYSLLAGLAFAFFLGASATAAATGAAATGSGGAGFGGRTRIFGG